MDEWLRRGLVEEPESPIVRLGLVGYLNELERRIDAREELTNDNHDTDDAGQII